MSRSDDLKAFVEKAERENPGMLQRLADDDSTNWGDPEAVTVRIKKAFDDGWRAGMEEAAGMVAPFFVASSWSDYKRIHARIAQGPTRIEFTGEEAIEEFKNGERVDAPPGS